MSFLYLAILFGWRNVLLNKTSGTILAPQVLQDVSSIKIPAVGTARIIFSEEEQNNKHAICQ